MSRVLQAEILAKYQDRSRHTSPPAQTKGQEKPCNDNPLREMRQIQTVDGPKYLNLNLSSDKSLKPEKQLFYLFLCE